jgi:hypothetical protein
MEMTLAIDEIRKRNEHGFDRSDGCDNTKQLRRFPIVPKSRIRIEKYRLNCTEISFNNTIKFSSVDDDINNHRLSKNLLSKNKKKVSLFFLL